MRRKLIELFVFGPDAGSEGAAADKAVDALIEKALRGL